MSNDAVTAAKHATAPRLALGEIVAMALCSLAMLLATALGAWPIGWVEVLGFVTGGVCVWLTVREHIATWPIGIANNVVFFMLFWQSRLFADASLQIVYLGLAVFGWWNWLRGGQNRTELRISRTSAAEWWLLAMLIPAATWALREVLIAVQGAAPFWDALTTVLSLAAQYLLCRKRLENWLLWMLADVIYIPLYLARSLPLTSVLYVVFLLMCVVGWVDWQRRWHSHRQPKEA